MTKSIILVGPRACGKTTVGKLLAADLKLTFVDSDEVLQRTTQRSVAQIVDEEGWEAFRIIESRILQNIATSGHVIATGGGMVLAENNRNHMKNNGVVFYLAACADELIKRLEANPAVSQRPSLTGLSILDEMVSVLKSREPLYQAASHFIVDANQDKKNVVQQITDYYYQHINLFS
ncbi:shikimate kinase AroL [Pantoea sp. B65]|uniref:shikimate kinase AroL n=1 Tax=Pantoea sp. B65 TaxID=2813359 RepID=UPI0039B3C5F6